MGTIIFELAFRARRHYKIPAQLGGGWGLRVVREVLDI